MEYQDEQRAEIISTKLGLLKLAERLVNVSEAHKVMGYSRDSLYHFKELYDYSRLYGCPSGFERNKSLC